METSLGFIKSPKVLLLLFGVLGILAIAALGVAITNSNDISGQTDNTETLTKELDDRIKSLEKQLSVVPEDPPEVCQTETCYKITNHLSMFIDEDIDPCFDFYQFTCGKWKGANALAPGQSEIGTFDDVTNKVGRVIQEIFSDLSTTTRDDPKPLKSLTAAMNYYTSCIDSDDLNTSGEVFYKTWFGINNGMGGYPLLNSAWDPNSFKLEKALAIIFYNFNIDTLFSTSVQVDSKNVKKHVITIDQGSLGLLQANFLKEEENKELLDAYNDLLMKTARQLSTLLGGQLPPSFEKDLKDIFNFEKELAKIILPAKDNRDPEKLYNEKTIKEMKTEYGNIDWLAHVNVLLKYVGLDVKDKEKTIVTLPKYFEDLNALLGKTSAKIISNYLHWRVLLSSLGDAPEAFQTLYSKFLKDGMKIEVRPKRTVSCRKTVAAPFHGMGGMGFAIAHEYVKRSFSNSTKGMMNDLVDGLKGAFTEMVEETSWMDDETKEKALEKAKSIIQELGYPDWLMDEAKLEAKYDKLKDMKKVEYLKNHLKVKSFEVGESLISLREDVNRRKWPLHPAVVNAVYSPSKNKITFPAGILQYPFFDEGAPNYLNFGSIGVVIGHEITHGFDDQGKQYNADGTLQSWWSQAADTEFKKKAQCIIDQYNNYVAGEIGMNLDGVNTQGENIADNGGLRQAFRAYKKSIESSGDPKRLPGKMAKYTPEQLFFVAYSQTWCEITSEADLLAQVMDNVHSPGKFRSWGAVSNSEDFVEAFKCPDHMPMNRGKDRCEVW